MALLSILHNLSGFFLCIESAMRNTVVEVGVGAEDRTRALCSDGCQLRKSLDFDAPALIVCQMPVETVHIVKRQQVDILLHEIC